MPVVVIVPLFIRRKTNTKPTFPPENAQQNDLLDPHLCLFNVVQTYD